MTSGAGDSPRLVVDTNDPTPAYEQLRRQLDEAIRSGAVRRGERLPPVRQLARDLGLAVGTAARAYQELEAAGLIRSARGGGTRVREDAPRLPDAARQEALGRLAAGYVRDGRRLGVQHDELVQAVRSALATDGSGTAGTVG